MTARTACLAIVLSLLWVAPAALTAQSSSPSITATDNEEVGPFRMPDAPLDAVLQLI